VRQVILFLVPRRFAETVQALLEAYVAGRAVLLRCALISLFAQLFLMVPFFVAGLVLGVSLDWRAVLMVVPLIFVSNLLPISPGGVGVGEATSAFLFAQFGIAEGAAIMVLVRIWIMVVQGMGGIIFLWHRDRKSPVAPVSSMDAE
jgi:uncharacterized membrane protein YbhN (UPF0104 family)